LVCVTLQYSEYFLTYVNGHIFLIVNKIQQVDNYFQLFELPISFTMDKDVLKQKFYKISRSAHPDFFTQASEAAKEAADAKYSEIIKAYELLSDDLPRIKYTLEILGVTLEDKTPLDSEFLMEMMDINERIEQVNQSIDKIEDHIIMDEIKAFEEQLNEQYKLALSAYESDSLNTEHLVSIKDYYLKTKYLLRIKENISTFALKL